MSEFANPMDMPRSVIDFETRSVLDVRDVGAWRYAEHPSTEILWLSYKTPGNQTKLWAPPVPFPEELTELAAQEDHVFEAHNAQFEMAVWLRILHEQLGIPMPKRWADTLAVCAYRSIPLGLDEVGRVLNLSTQKDKRGKYLLQQLSKPRKPNKAEKKEFEELGIPPEKWPVLWREDWELLEELGSYCATDTDTEHLLGQTIGDLPLPEYRLWTLDQRINYRGIHVDVEAVEAAIGIVELLAEQMEGELVKLTGGAVTGGGQVAKIRDWLDGQGFYMPNLQAETVENALKNLSDQVTNGECPPEEIEHIYRVLEIRQTLGSSSIKKLYKFIECLCRDNRIRGLLQYHGAGTGRWSGRLVQPQNFPRGELEDFVERLGLKDAPDGAERTMEILIETIKLGGQDAIDMLGDLFGSVIDALITALRGMFIAAPGMKYHVADFSAIEAVVTSWLAGEAWKLDAFRAIQRGEGYNGAPDMYCATASMVFGKPITSKKEFPKERQVGKVCELAFGYQGGVGAWRNFDKSDRYDDPEVDFFKTQWRDKHPATRDLWYGLENAALDALRLNRRVAYRYVAFEPVVDDAGKWLTAILPNGRRLWYYNPRLEDVKMPWGDWKKQVSYEGRDNKKGGRWGRIRTYGGMLTENVVQAISRDLMAEAMVRVELRGYSIILTVHDEIISEDPEDFGSQEEFEALMSIVPEWAPDCPVAVAGWEGYRYRKD